MAQYSSISAFSQSHPSYDEAWQFVCVSPEGEIRQIIVPIYDYPLEVKSIMTSYLFVNDWHVFSQQIKNFK